MSLNVEYALGNNRDILAGYLKEGRLTPDHIKHYEKGYTQVANAAKNHLLEALGSQNHCPQIYKPSVIRFEQYAPQIKFSLGFTEGKRTEAERIGIIYTNRVIEAGDPNKVAQAVAHHRELLRGEPELDAFKPEEYYIADLYPINPGRKMLNHDAGMFEECLGTAYYIDLVGEGKIKPFNPYELTTFTDSEEYSAHVELEEPKNFRHFRQLQKWFDAAESIPDLLEDYQRKIITMTQNKTLFGYEGNTYLKKYDCDFDKDLMSVLTGVDFMHVRYHINVEELLKWRNIFADPEQIYKDDEYGLTFMVPGGIPLKAIAGFDLWSDFGNNPPPARS